MIDECETGMWPRWMTSFMFFIMPSVPLSMDYSSDQFEQFCLLKFLSKSLRFRDIWWKCWTLVLVARGSVRILSLSLPITVRHLSMTRDWRERASKAGASATRRSINLFSQLYRERGNLDKNVNKQNCWIWSADENDTLYMQWKWDNEISMRLLSLFS